MDSVYASSLSAMDRRLGSPGGSGPLGFAAALARDEAEAFPTEALAALAALELPQLQAPDATGGSVASFEEAAALAVAIARRDPALALTQGMQLWLWLVWIAGTPSQQQWARALLASHRVPAFGASEAEHGADLGASETLAVAKGGTWQITGKKWPIGCASRAPFGFVLARTRLEAGPRSLSWFLVDLSSPGVQRLPKVPTVGMRAADLAGFHLERVDGDLVGPLGHGLDLTLKVFQVTRPLLACAGLGIADTALRIAARFALERRLYGASALELPSVRQTLAQAWLDFLSAEVLLLSTLRALHVTPEQLSLASPLTKAIVPLLVDRALRGAASVLGARAFLRSGESAMFQKVQRDAGVLALIDGSTPVCLQALALELPRVFQKNTGDHARAERRLRLNEPVPPFDAARLELTSRGADDVTAAVPRELAGARDRLFARSRELAGPNRLEVARAYGLLHTASCAVQFERSNPELGICQRGVLALAAKRLLDPQTLDEAGQSIVVTELVERVKHDRLLSLTSENRGPRSLE